MRATASISEPRVPAGKRSDYYPTLQDALAYPAEHKLLFRMVRREAA